MYLKVALTLPAATTVSPNPIGVRMPATVSRQRGNRCQISLTTTRVSNPARLSAAELMAKESNVGSD